jgi:hypothetical protein
MMVSPPGPKDSTCFILPYREAIPAARIINVGFIKEVTKINENRQLVKTCSCNHRSCIFEKCAISDT